MNENAKKWVAALRSGRYKQDGGELQGRDGYCCLGVACAVYEEVHGDVLFKGSGGYYTGGFLDGSYARVREWLGLTSKQGCFEDADGFHNTLVNVNDSSGANFNDIADVIEREPKGLFK